MNRSLKDIAEGILGKGPVKVEDSPRRVRVIFGGEYIADTTTAKYVWEVPYYPQYYIHKSDTALKGAKKAPQDGFSLLTLKKGDQDVPESAIEFESGILKDYVRLTFKLMDQWLEEDEAIYVHPKDPYKRVDVARSTRPIKVEIDGVTVAETPWAVHLFETGLPVRYYLPQASVRRDMIKPTDTVTSCPYKGDANYFEVTVNGKTHKDIIWWYKHATIDCLAINGMFCFYNEKVDIWLDGKKLERAKTHFS